MSVGGRIGMVDSLMLLVAIVLSLLLVPKPVVRGADRFSRWTTSPVGCAPSDHYPLIRIDS